MELLILSAEIIVKAGREIVKIYAKEDFDVVIKEDHSPLTLADRTSRSEEHTSELQSH